MADQGTPRDAQGEIIVTLYDPVTIEAIVLDWDGASPSEYTIEISNHGEVWTEVAHLKDLESPGAANHSSVVLECAMTSPSRLSE